MSKDTKFGKQPTLIHRKDSNSQYWYIKYWHKKQDRWRYTSTRTKDYSVALDQLANFVTQLNTPSKDNSRSIAWCINYYLKARPDQDIKDFKPTLRLLGDMPVETISASLCREYVRIRTQENVDKSMGWKTTKKISVGGAKVNLAMLKAAINFCYLEKQIATKPNFYIPPEQPPREYDLSVEQQENLLEKTEQFHTYLFILLALATGARVGALLGLKWKKIIHGSIDLRDPKFRNNKRRGIVPLIKGSELEEALTIAYENRKTDYVIEYKGKPIKRIERSLSTASKQAGINFKLTPHILKHTAITHMLNEGVPIEDVSDYTQTSITTISKTYGHYTQERGIRTARIVQRTRPSNRNPKTAIFAGKLIKQN